MVALIPERVRDTTRSARRRRASAARGATRGTEVAATHDMTSSRDDDKPRERCGEPEPGVERARRSDATKEMAASLSGRSSGEISDSDTHFYEPKAQDGWSLPWHP